MKVVRGRPARDRNEYRDAVWCSNLKPHRRLAALCFADHAGDGNTNEVWVATARGVERTGMGRTAWHESRKGLESAGWLLETVPATYTESARYQLTIPSGQCRETDTPLPGDGHPSTGRRTEPLQTSAEPASKEDPVDDLATWLAANLDADRAACAAAIAMKQRQAETKGNPWRSPVTMVKQTIPLDEWRPLVARSAPAPKRATLAQCSSLEPHGSHKWEDARNLFHCQGVDHDQLAAVGT